MQNENLNESNIFRIMDCKAEIERIRFVLSSYLRTRIHKIEKFAKYIERTSSEMEKLSPAEKTWVKECLIDRYNKGLDRHFKDSALKYLPPNMQKLDEVDGYAELDMVTKPDLDGTVCIQVLEDIGEYSLSNREDQEDTIRMEKGQIYFLRYSSIRQLLDEGRVRMT
ncbi:hypothetical protein BKA69DRAFT_15227 [Paraphysoderma sedebokerense]|nr:hypothetical protein BKA69DRAFT_15227 [Paraphysoderma sedebokerense]